MSYLHFNQKKKYVKFAIRGGLEYKSDRTLRTFNKKLSTREKKKLHETRTNLG